MSTKNFCSKNTNYIYALNNNQIEFDLEDIQEDIINQLNQRGITTYKYDEYDKEKSYPGRCFAVSIGGSVNLCGYEITLKLSLKVVSGYYSGANLDFDYMYTIEDEDYDNIEDVIDRFIDFLDYDNLQGIGQIHKNKIYKLEDQARQAMDQIETVYRDNSKRLICTAVFSSGEASYLEI